MSLNPKKSTFSIKTIELTNSALTEGKTPDLAEYIQRALTTQNTREKARQLDLQKQCHKSLHVGS
tara:strand:+ start:17789 stop:17983 length:195 start_codon:yes stop_codon:yes gene_type:complete